jgi:hypothetical protein
MFLTEIQLSLRRYRQKVEPKMHFLFSLFVVCLISFSNSSPICSVIGSCNGNIVEKIENVESREKCLQACKNEENCNW